MDAEDKGEKFLEASSDNIYHDRLYDRDRKLVKYSGKGPGHIARLRRAMFSTFTPYQIEELVWQIYADAMKGCKDSRRLFLQHLSGSLSNLKVKFKGESVTINQYANVPTEKLEAAARLLELGDNGSKPNQS